MVGGVVGSMFGGPIGSQIGSQVGAGLGGMLENLIGQHGQSNVQSAMNNNMMGSLVGQLSQAIQSHPGIPQFARDEMCQALGSAQQSCPADPATPGCQRDTDDAMGGLIDKIVDKVVDMIMDKLQGGGGCESGDFGKMLREAVEEVVREKIGGGAESGGGCANGSSAANDGSAAAASGGSASSSSSSADNSYDQVQDNIMFGNARSEQENEGEATGKKGKGNWLVVLAGSLAAVQTKFLDAAMENMDTMEKNAADSVHSDKKTNDEGHRIDENGNVMSDEDAAKADESADKKEKAARDKFIMAQYHYQANTQMFNMIANMTATSLKSLGEGLTAIARKS